MSHFPTNPYESQLGLNPLALKKGVFVDESSSKIQRSESAGLCIRLQKDYGNPILLGGQNDEFGGRSPMRHRVLELVCEGEPCHSGLFQWGAPGYVALNVGSTV